jgi:hypothetical protein
MVWCRVQFKGVHSGVLHFGRPVNPTGIAVIGAPEVMSLTFNDAGKCTRVTADYVVDNTVGNTGGWGGMRGIMYAIGKPVPEPWTLGGKLCAAFPALLGFTSTMGVWALNTTLFVAVLTGGGRAPKPVAPPPPVKAAVAKAASAPPIPAPTAAPATAPAAAPAAAAPTAAPVAPAAAGAADAPAAAEAGASPAATLAAPVALTPPASSK